MASSSASTHAVDILHCQVCGKTAGESSSKKLLTCSRCRKTYYCGRACQTKDWKEHKPNCEAPVAETRKPDPGEAMRDIDASWAYWVHTTATNPPAISLARRLRLDLPKGDLYGFKAGMMYPMRRLVTTGEDTPENMATLFGPTWEKDVKKLHGDCRIEVLLCPPPGSPSHAVATHLDQGSPMWTPRPPSEEEEKKIKQVREMSKMFEGMR